MKTLNIGCGEDEDGDVRLDMNRNVQPNIQADVRNLPISDKKFDRVIADQVIEHIESEEIIDVMAEVYRVLKQGGLFEFWVPHAGSRLYTQDPTHKSEWSYRTIDYYTNGPFSYYYEDEDFEFETVERDMDVWVHPERFLSAPRTYYLRVKDRLLGNEDTYAWEGCNDASLYFKLRKI